MVFERPKNPNKPQPSNSSNPATRRFHPNNKPNNNNQHNQNAEKLPPIWLKHPLEPNSTPNPDANAGFVEYLRWMRSHDDYKDDPEYNYEDYKDTAKLQILQLVEENADYKQRLSELNKRTELIAGESNCFEVTCPWRIRVGGHRGPESILLPAFDALGMPCILSSTLRGVARNQAIQQFIAEGMTQQQAETEVMRYFGGLDTEKKEDSMGKVIFLDAYPKPVSVNKSGGLSVDIANNIWSWENNNLNYKPNPQTFLSLKQSTFVIGIRPTSSCSSEILEKVKKWLIAGLQSGIGSQVNTGYGRLISPNSTEYQHFFQVPFTIQGQLIHGKQKFVNLHQPYKEDRNNLVRDRNNNLKPNTSSDTEVKTIAFKSMLRYWFRVLSLGVLPIGKTTETYLKEFVEGRNTRPPAEVKALEAILFGSITPQARGWVQFQVTDGKLVQAEAKTEKNDPGEQSGILILNYSSEAPQEHLNAINKLFTNLTWMMFHLGGVGQGARRPCYSRQGRNPEAKPPKWRGSTLIPKSKDDFWQIPSEVKEFKQLFRKRLQAFYTALQELTGNTINHEKPRDVDLKEAVDRNCQIIVCTGKKDFNKPYALTVLHSQEFKINRNNQTVYDEILCGKSEKPSPVIIADLGDYQVVTVFGANQNKRQQYIEKLSSGTSQEQYAQIFPFES
ncbi:RAMP superfamily CRISPR-associated protein [Rivularia sp. UHCC 0363]|uniref:RAMP superfamily CRISPR-associated protein n=1 Tax=Rivularia sp. UHCC 0363 TaxID=3110244 RepID=UPI002B21B063|nr:RAMP superfamily CRISPR-associated protein [Rivularia sp. UHCC 0363]MEA5594744.1 RAMP superfamily CRISPR-associated protein [Rivularia sp. UHCC 0363]